MYLVGIRIDKAKKHTLYFCDCIRNHQSASAVQRGYQVQTSLICQSLFFSNTQEEREGKLVNESSRRRTQHVGLGAMWCEINRGGVRKGWGEVCGGNKGVAKGRQQWKKKGIHASLRRETTLQHSCRPSSQSRLPLQRKHYLNINTHTHTPSRGVQR